MSSTHSPGIFEDVVMAEPVPSPINPSAVFTEGSTTHDIAGAGRGLRDGR
jgi:hypothetical protein